MSQLWNLSIEIPEEMAAWLQDRATRFFHGDLQDAARYVFEETMKREAHHAAVVHETGAPPFDPWATLNAQVRKRPAS
jgi:hypothetical protein